MAQGSLESSGPSPAQGRANSTAWGLIQLNWGSLQGWGCCQHLVGLCPQAVLPSGEHFFSPEVASELPLLQLVPVAPSPFAVQGGDAVHGCPEQVPCCTGLLHPWVGFCRVEMLQSGPALHKVPCSTQSSCRGTGKLSAPNWKITPHSPGAALGANPTAMLTRLGESGAVRAAEDHGHQPQCTSLP